MFIGNAIGCYHLSVQSFHLVVNTERSCPCHLVSRPPREPLYWVLVHPSNISIFCKYDHVHFTSPFEKERQHMMYTILYYACFSYQYTLEIFPFHTQKSSSFFSIGAQYSIVQMYPSYYKMLPFSQQQIPCAPKIILCRQTFIC